MEGNITIKGDLNRQWIENTVAHLPESFTTVIIGNVSIDGNVFDDGLGTLIIIGDVFVNSIYAGDCALQIKGNVYCKRTIVGEYNDGSLHISGKTQVPFIVNSDHDLDGLQTEVEGALTIDLDEGFYKSGKNQEKFNVKFSKAFKQTIYDEYNEELDMKKLQEYLFEGKNPFLK